MLPLFDKALILIPCPCKVLNCSCRAMLYHIPCVLYVHAKHSPENFVDDDGSANATNDPPIMCNLSISSTKIPL